MQTAAAAIPVVNPSTRELVDQVPLSTLADVDRACRDAAAAFGPWSHVPFAERAAVLQRTAALLRAHQEELAATLVREQGKPLKEARIEVARCADTFDYYAVHDPLAGVETRTIPGKQARIVRRPLGVCAAIVPWNFPLTLMANKLVPALAAGNSVVVKPAPTTPLAARACIALLYEAGLPANVVTVVLGGADVGEALITHELVRKVSFTGSTQTGKAIMALAARGLKRLTLELGGNDAMIVCADADVSGAARAAAIGRFFNAGQACIATKRIYVERPVYDAFVEQVATRAKQLGVGDGFDPNVRMGPLHSEAQRAAVEGFVQDATARGARVAAGGGRPQEPGSGWFYEPTVLTDVPESSALVRDECFGPVLPVFAFDRFEEALERANGTRFGLGSSIWSRDEARIDTAIRELDAGYTWVNDIATDYDALPFGGFKESGFGKERGLEVLDEYTERKSVVSH